MFGDKLFPNQPGYPTPEEIPEETTCLILQIPANSSWWAVYSGLLLTLIDEKSWQQFDGGIAREDAVAEAFAIFNDAMQSASVGWCALEVPTPYWDSATSSDDVATPEAQTWYGFATVDYGSPPEVSFVERIGIWAIAGFIAYAGAPGAALFFLTIADKFVLAFKTGDIGAIIDIIVDSSRVAQISTYSVDPGILRVAVELDPEASPHTLYVVKDDDPDTLMQVVRDELNPNDVTPPNRRYNSGTDTVEIQGWDGTWGENVDADPRSSPAYVYPIITADDIPCQSASNMSRWINNLIDDVLVILPAAFDAAGLLTILVGLFLTLGPFAIVIDLILALAFILFGAGTTAISAAFTNEVYDQLICIFYCNVDTDGRMSAEQLAAAQAQIDAEIGGLAATVLDAIFFLAGNVGVTNIGTIDDGEAVDCSGCDCGWCYEFDFTIDEQGWSGFNDGTDDRAVYSAGNGWEPNDAYIWLGLVQIVLPTFDSAVITSWTTTFSERGAPDNDLQFRMSDVGGADYFSGNVDVPSGTSGGATGFSSTGTGFFAGYVADPDASAGTYPGYITSIRVTGTGTNPFGEDNC